MSTCIGQKNFHKSTPIFLVYFLTSVTIILKARLISLVNNIYYLYEFLCSNVLFLYSKKSKGVAFTYFFLLNS